MQLKDALQQQSLVACRASGYAAPGCGAVLANAVAALSTYSGIAPIFLSAADQAAILNADGNGEQILKILAPQGVDNLTDDQLNKLAFTMAVLTGDPTGITAIPAILQAVRNGDPIALLQLTSMLTKLKLDGANAGAGSIIPAGFAPYQAMSDGTLIVADTTTGELKLLTQSGVLTDLPPSPIPASMNATVVPQSVTSIVYGGGIKQQGLPWEDYLATKLGADTRLPANFPTIDFFDSTNGLATSAKTLDTASTSYLANPNQIYAKITGYVDDLAGFSEGRLSNQVVKG